MKTNKKIMKANIDSFFEDLSKPFLKEIEIKERVISKRIPIFIESNKRFEEIQKLLY